MCLLYYGRDSVANAPTDPTKRKLRVQKNQTRKLSSPKVVVEDWPLQHGVNKLPLVSV